jgi:hypothetical protein
MSLSQWILVAAVAFFVVEGFSKWLTIPVKWWALGVACYLASLATA